MKQKMTPSDSDALYTIWLNMMMMMMMALEVRVFVLTSATLSTLFGIVVNNNTYLYSVFLRNNSNILLTLYGRLNIVKTLK